MNLPVPVSTDPAGVERGIAFLRRRTKEMGLRGSLVRDAVARVALERDRHFTAEDLSKELRARGFQYAHTSTVYRTLPLLVRVGILRVTRATVGDHTRYERVFERERLDYIVCSICRMTLEVSCVSVDSFQSEMAAKYGFKAASRVLEIHGVCAECQSKEQQGHSNESTSEPHGNGIEL
jgi:Fur family transcriptional regulator, ferric uptake regulator